MNWKQATIKCCELFNIPGAHKSPTCRYKYMAPRTPPTPHSHPIELRRHSLYCVIVGFGHRLSIAALGRTRIEIRGKSTQQWTKCENKSFSMSFFLLPNTPPNDLYFHTCMHMENATSTIDSVNWIDWVWTQSVGECAKDINCLESILFKSNVRVFVLQIDCLKGKS